MYLATKNNELYLTG